MEQLSKIFPNFVASFHKEWLHRGELLSLEPLENLENSCVRVISLKGCSSCRSIYTTNSYFESVHIYTCRCELIFILTYTGIPEPSS